MTSSVVVVDNQMSDGVCDGHDEVVVPSKAELIQRVQVAKQKEVMRRVNITQDETQIDTKPHPIAPASATSPTTTNGLVGLMADPVKTEPRVPLHVVNYAMLLPYLLSPNQQEQHEQREQQQLIGCDYHFHFGRILEVVVDKMVVAYIKSLTLTLRTPYWRCVANALAQKPTPLTSAGGVNEPFVQLTAQSEVPEPARFCWSTAPSEAVDITRFRWD